MAHVHAQLRKTATGYLFGAQPTAADFATAALLEPLVPAAAELGYADLPGWADVAAFVDRVRPARSSA